MVSPGNISPMAKKPRPLSSSSPSSSQRFSDGFLFFIGSLIAVVLVWSLWSISAPKPRPVIDLREQIPNTDDSAEKRSLEDPPAGKSFYIGAPVKGWDKKRREWLKRNPSFTGNKKERILMLTGSQPHACKNPIGDHLLLRFFKNKVDYCRIHGHEILYNDALLEPLMGSYWAKLPVVRAAMVAHPEADWIWWVDSDAAFTDMSFSPPLDRYKSHDLVVHGWTHLVHKKRSWTGLNAGVFLIRNSQWAMDFIEDWAQMGPQTPNYKSWGARLKRAFPDKAYPESDDQTGLAYLIVDPKRRWTDKIYLESEYYFEGYWDEIVNEKNLIRSGGAFNATSARPFVTHFTGCQPCSGAHNEMYSGESCWGGMKKALNYADNQVLRAYGFVHPTLLDSSVEKIRYDQN